MYQNNRYPKTKSKPKKLATPKGIFVLGVVVVMAIILAGGFFLIQNKNKEAANSNTQQPAESFNKKRYSLSDPASPWVVVNKQRILDPKDFAPVGLRLPDMKVESQEMLVNNETAMALDALSVAAGKDNVSLMVVSAYRSFDTQANIYDSEVRGYGQAQADRESARPGHSEHQTGWAADLGASSGKCEIKACFVDTPEGQWLAANAYKYGFVIRYPEGKEDVTGYMYEPWHVRYVGIELSTEMHAKNIKTLEEFFNLPAAPAY